MKAETKQKILDTIKARSKSEKDVEKMQALQALSLFEDAKADSVGDLITMVIDGDKRQRASAVESLIGIGEKAVEEVITRLCNNEDDLDARMQGISIIANILATEAQKPKTESEEHSGCTEAHDPHGLGPIMRNAFKKVLKEALEEMGKDAVQKD